AELAVKVLRPLVQLRAPVDDVAQHLLLNLVEGEPHREGEQRQPVGVRNPPRVDGYAPADRGAGDPLAGERLQQTGQSEAAVDSDVGMWRGSRSFGAHGSCAAP